MYDRFGYPGLFAAYNAGPARYAGVLSGARPLPAATRAYVAAIAGPTAAPPRCTAARGRSVRSAGTRDAGAAIATAAATTIRSGTVRAAQQARAAPVTPGRGGCGVRDGRQEQVDGIGRTAAEHRAGRADCSSSASAGGGATAEACAAARRMRTVLPRSASGPAGPACFSTALPAARPRPFFGRSRPIVFSSLAAGAPGEPRPGKAGGLEEAAARLWAEARAVADTPASAYLASRGLAMASPELRFHPRTPHGPRPVTRYRPALIAAVRDGSGLVAIHRTFLDPDRPGLARLADPRRGLGRFGAGAVRLGGSGPRLGLAEGIETALSAAVLFDVPCWATLGTERFGRVAIPGTVRELLLFLDHDCGGRRAERLAREAFAHVPRIVAHVPDRPGEDWNDVLRARRTGSRAG